MTVKVQPTQCGAGYRKDCINNSKCIFWHTGEIVGELVSKYSAKFQSTTVASVPNGILNDETTNPQPAIQPAETPTNHNTRKEMSKKEKRREQRNELSIGTFNVRSIADDTKKFQLSKDMKKYGLDICALQECKIKEGIDKRIGDSENGCRLITFKTIQKAYGNGFIVSNRMSNRIEKCWKVNDRISVIQLNMENDIDPKRELRNKYTDYSKAAKPQISSKKKTRKKGKEPSTESSRIPKKVLNIINVYAPTTTIVKKDVKILDQLYSKIQTLHNALSSNSNSTTMIVGDFNSKVGKKEHEEEINCIGKFSRGRRNISGQHLINFCEINNLFISNSAFRHPARHITTYSSTFVNSTGEVKNYYSMIDFILINQKLRHSLINARSYGGTLCPSDHKLVVTRMNIRPFIMFRKKSKPLPQDTKFNTTLLTSNKAVKDQYQKCINNIISRDQETTPSESTNKKWELVENTVRTAAKETLGIAEKKKKDKHTFSQVVEELSIQSKNIRINMMNTKDANNIKAMRKERNTIQRKIKDQLKLEHNTRIQRVVNEIEEAGKAGNSKKMYAAIKNMKRKSQKEITVLDADKRVLVSPNSVYKAVTTHYQNHFYKDNHENIIRFSSPPSPLNNPITTQEVHDALKGMTNQRAAYDDISAELLKYGPEELHKIIAEALNDLVENHKEIDVGIGKIAPLEKPKKPMPCPPSDLRPIILLKVIRKVLSKISLARLKPKFEEYLSPAQCAYRNNRSTTDAIWAYRWILAKVQEEQTTIFITGIDMSAAFDTINRSILISLIEEFADEDEKRMVRILLSDTKLEVKLISFDGEKVVFQCNRGAPQGDSLSGPLFTVYFEHALRNVRLELESTPVVEDHPYTTHIDTRLDIPTPSCDHAYQSAPSAKEPPPEITFADDMDHLTTNQEVQNKFIDIVNGILESFGLAVNSSKTEKTTLKRGDKETELWRNVIKLGNCLGDVEDIARRKQLASISFKEMKEVWIDGHAVSLDRKVQLLDALVMSVLLYNSSCLGLRKADVQAIDSFHRNLLRKISNISYPNTISSKKLYKSTKSRPASIRIVEARWKYFGHALRLPLDTPPQHAMSYYFTDLHKQKFKGAKRTTIVTTLQADIKRTKEKFPIFQIESLDRYQDLIKIRQVASDRKLWQKIVKSVVNTAEAEHQEGLTD